MAKKKTTIDLRSVDPTPVPSGDVNIIYNGVRIGGFSEDTEAVLKTAGCRVEQDINVNYTVPAGGPALTQFSMTYTGSGSEPQTEPSDSYLAKDDNNNLISLSPYAAEYIIPSWSSRESEYVYTVVIKASADIYTVTINGEPIPFDIDTEDYFASITSPTPLQAVTVIIADKQV